MAFHGIDLHSDSFVDALLNVDGKVEVNILTRNLSKNLKPNYQKMITYLSKPVPTLFGFTTKLSIWLKNVTF